jgi:hypothetical protein
MKKYTTEELKKLPDEMREELTLNISNYNKLDTSTGYVAYASLILQLLFMKPGTYPNSPNLGLDIGKYQFDLFDESEINEIEREIRDQLHQYLPQTESCNILVDSISLNDLGNKILGLGFSLYYKDGTYEFFVYIKQDNSDLDIRAIIQ